MVQASLKKSTTLLNQSIQRMTTGYRINSAKDDAAGYTVAKKMDIQLSSYNVAKDNTEIGLSYLNTATSTLDTITTQLQRIRDLTEEASNGTYGTDSRNAMQQEINARTAELNRILSSTEYNGKKIFDSGNSATGYFLNSVTPLTDSEATAQGYTVLHNATELEAISGSSGKYILMGNIDLSGVSFSTITNFSGELNGNGYVISNWYSEASGATASSFVDQLNSGGVIKNLGMENVSFNITDPAYGASGLVNGNSGLINNCYVTGSVDGVYETAGLVLYNTGTISNSYSNVSNAMGAVAYDNSGSIVNSYWNSDNVFSVGVFNGPDSATAVDSNTLDSLTIDPSPSGGGISFKIGIGSSSSSTISVDPSFSLSLSVNVSSASSASNSLDSIDSALATITKKQTELGAVYNRLQSASDSIDVSITNLTSSLSTIRDTDVAKESANYIKQQILQQASATLLTTANQLPSIALSLI